MKINFDFRCENGNDKRMIVENIDVENILDKIYNNINNKPSLQIISDTGTFVVIDNSKVLHARSQLNINRQIASSCISQNNLPRLLYRSKGPISLY